MKKYIPAYLLFSLIIAGIAWYVSKDYPASESEMMWMIFGYFFILTLAFHYGIVQTTRSRPQVFIRYFMAATTIKLLLHLGIIVMYSMFHREMAVKFIFTFMIMYFLFTLFEVILLSRVKRK